MKYYVGVLKSGKGKLIGFPKEYPQDGADRAMKRDGILFAFGPFTCQREAIQFRSNWDNRL